MTGPCARRSPRRNPLLIGRDEFAGAAPTKGNGTHIPTPAISHALTPSLATAPALALAPALTPVATPNTNNDLSKQFIKVYLAVQTHPISEA